MSDPEAPPPAYDAPPYAPQANDLSRQQSDALSRQQSAPPYRASHAFANSQEELAALQQFARSKLYIQQGKDGTLGDIRGGMYLNGPVNWNNTPELKEERRQMTELRRRQKEEKKRAKEGDGSGRRPSVSQRLKNLVGRREEEKIVR